MGYPGYPVEIRTAAIRNSLQLPDDQLCAALGIAVVSLRRYRSRYAAQGNVNPDDHGGGRNLKLDQQQANLVAWTVRACPTLTLSERTLLVHAIVGNNSITEHNIHTTLQRLGVTRKLINYLSKSQVEVDRIQFFLQPLPRGVRGVPDYVLLDLDEMYVNFKKTHRRWAYSRVGDRAIVRADHVCD
jgi:hypothetical protein